MNKKHGFTLIELLAVIVVLAIIALIATPIVMNTIKRSKKGAAERSADSYVKQVEVAVATERLNGNILEGEYQITSDGNLCRDKSASCSDDKKIKIEMNGTKPSGGKVTISNGEVSQNRTTMIVGDYGVSYDNYKNNYTAQELYKGVLCTANTTKVSALVFDSSTGSAINQEVGLLASESDAYTPGVTYTCELGDDDSKTFFVLETNGDNVSLIAGFNLGNSKWISKEDYLAAGGEDLSNDKLCQDSGYCATNEYGPITAENYLKTSTASWTKLAESQISLPSYDQIYKASGLPTWLVSSPTITYGYWTSTPFVNDSFASWNVSCAGYLIDRAVIDESVGGVRPVITISKSQLN